MNKIFVLVACLATIIITSCDKDIENPKILTVYSGYYLKGSATPFNELNDAAGMPNGASNSTFNKFVELNAGEIIITNENNSTLEMANSIVYGLNDQSEFVAGGNVIAFTEEAGHYIIHGDVENKTIDYTKITSWGIIGSATPTGWGSDTDMTLSSSENGVYKYTIDVHLIGGEWLKFRANDNWTPQFGVNDGILTLRYNDDESDPGSIQVPETGDYTITLTLGANFTYELKKK